MGGPKGLRKDYFNFELASRYEMHGLEGKENSVRFDVLTAVGIKS
jgi:hypothetical protein